MLRLAIISIALLAWPQEGLRRATERAIQAAAIDSLFVRDTTRAVVVGDSTIAGGTHFVDEDYRSALRMLGELPAGLREDYEARRDQRRAVDSLPSRVRVIPFGPSQRARLRGVRDPREYWKAFYRDYPSTPGWIAVSRPGLSRDGQAALVLIEYGCGSRCGGTMYVMLARRGHAWRVTRVAQPRFS
jgi:hypothetical protein